MRLRLLKHTVKASLRRCNALKNIINAYREDFWAVRGPRDLLNSLDQLNKGIENYMAGFREGDDTVLKALARDEGDNIRLTCTTIGLIHDLLGYLEGARSTNIPNEIIRPLNELNKDFLSIENSEIMLRAIPELNYYRTPVSGTIEGMIKPGDMPFGATCEVGDFVVLDFPRAEKNNVLAHCILGHELGHNYLKRNTDIASDVLSAFRDDRELRNRHSDDVFVLNKWAEELSSDLLGIYIIGPAYFFAFLDIIPYKQSLTASTEKHPCPAFRIKAMIELLKSNGMNSQSFYDVYATDQKSTNTRNLIDYWWKLTRYLIPNEHRSDIIFYNNYFRNHNRSINDAIVNRLSNYGPSYKPEDLRHDIEFYPNIIANNIPLPEDFLGYGGDEFSRIPSPVPFRNILNAGWETLIRNTPEFRKSFGFERNEVEGYDKYNELLLKSIDLSTIKDRWEGARSRVVGR